MLPRFVRATKIEPLFRLQLGNAPRQRLAATGLVGGEEARDGPGREERTERRRRFLGVYPWRNCPSICLECIIKKESERERERERERGRGTSPEIDIARKKDEVRLQM